MYAAAARASSSVRRRLAISGGVRIDLWVVSLCGGGIEAAPGPTWILPQR
jgi:hypothetical protein